MITYEDLQAAIAECQGVKHPNAKTCIELAAFLTIQQRLFGQMQEISGASCSAPEKPGTVSAISDSEFSGAVAGMPVDDVMRIMDELMQAVQVLAPRLYAATMRKIKEA